jgi:hypothetical protein
MSWFKFCYNVHTYNSAVLISLRYLITLSYPRLHTVKWLEEWLTTKEAVIAQFEVQSHNLFGRRKTIRKPFTLVTFHLRLKPARPDYRSQVLPPEPSWSTQHCNIYLEIHCYFILHFDLQFGEITHHCTSCTSNLCCYIFCSIHKVLCLVLDLRKVNGHFWWPLLMVLLSLSKQYTNL